MAQDLQRHARVTCQFACPACHDVLGVAGLLAFDNIG
jgi:hypothetical protein